MQCIIGAYRAGFIVDYVPSNVVQGLRCAIDYYHKTASFSLLITNNLVELKLHLLETTEEFVVAPVYELYHHLNICYAIKLNIYHDTCVF